MTVGFIFDEDNKNVTPLNAAEAIIKSETFTIDALKELNAYLSVFIKHNQFYGERRK